MLSKLLIATAGLVVTASAQGFDCSGPYFSFFNRGGSAMSYQRLDPALFPGAASPHLHAFDGGNGLTASMSFEQTQGSTCTTARIKPDKSLYWRPPLFWNGNNTGFYRVPEKSTKIYYKYGDGNDWANVTEFPEDFHMLAGKPNKRSDGDNPAGIRWGCHNGDDKIFDNGFPKFSDCSYGFASEVTFPSCWNGENIDPQNPGAHMAYPTGYSGVGVERCPETHRIARFPTIFIEFWYDISSFKGHYTADDTPWVLSNGDPTGYGFHADFMNGWEKGVLAKATAQTGGCRCGCGCGQEEMEQCFGAENVNKDNAAEFEECSAPLTFGGDDMAHLETLPGCNPLQYGPADATANSGPSCDTTAAPAPGKTSAPTSSKSSAYNTPPDSESSENSSYVTPAPSPPATAEPSSGIRAMTSSLNSYNSGVAKDDAEVKPTLTVKLPQKQHNDDLQGERETKTSALTAASSKTPGKSGLYQPVNSGGPTKPISSPASDEHEEGECKPVVYVTVTPTVYVTAEAVANKITTACDLGTLYQTITETATVTVAAAYGFGQFDSY